jgi:hypothetical protein
MLITEDQLAILVPVFKAPKGDVEKFLDQLSRLSIIPRLFFVYEQDSCTFDIVTIISDWCKTRNVKHTILTMSGRQGLGLALNTAVLNITEKFIIRHDIGDDFLENRVDDILNSLNTCEDIDILYSQAFLSDGQLDKISKYPTTTRGLEKLLIVSNPICHPTVVLKRESILRIGNYNSKLKFCEDLDLWLRAKKSGLKFHCINKPTIRYFNPKNGRETAHWKTNFWVRIENFGSPNYVYSILSLVIVIIFLSLPKSLKTAVYQVAKR